MSSRVDGQDGQVDRLDPPAVMLEHALERRRAVDVADQADRGRVEVGGRPCTRSSSAALMTGSIVR